MKESLCSGCSGGMRCVLVCLAVMATIFHKSDAILCEEGDVKVMGTNTANLKAGYIEMCIGGEVRAVCALDWNDDDAIVTCRQLGFTGGYQAFGCGNSCFGRSNETTAGIRGFQCSNQEMRLIDCSRSTDASHTCVDNAGVVCINRERPECPTTQPSPLTTSTQTNSRMESAGDKTGTLSDGRIGGAQQSCLALGGGLGALSVILAILLVGVAIGWAWSCRRRTGAKELAFSTSQNPSYTTTAQADQVPPVQYNTIAKVWGKESEGELMYEEIDNPAQQAATPSAREESTDTEYY